MKKMALALAIAMVPGAAAAQTIPGLPNVYQSTKLKQCANAAGDCILSLATIPANRVLKLTNINCNAGISGNPPRAEFVLFTDPLTADSVLNSFVVPTVSVRPV